MGIGVGASATASAIVGAGVDAGVDVDTGTLTFTVTELLVAMVGSIGPVRGGASAIELLISEADEEAVRSVEVARIAEAAVNVSEGTEVNEVRSEVVVVEVVVEVTMEEEDEEEEGHGKGASWDDAAAGFVSGSAARWIALLNLS